jgi:prefoldin subunit 5
MDKTPHPVELLADLETRQEQVLARLEELDRRIETVLAQWQAAKPAEQVPVEY